MIEFIAWIVVVAIICLVLGWNYGAKHAAQKATNHTLATVAMTGYVTYGEDWWNDFLDEMKSVSESEQTAIHALTLEMEKEQ